MDELARDIKIQSGVEWMRSSFRYFERYEAGEHIDVWSELIALGENVREEPLRSEAIRVCREVVRRARYNLRTLYNRLLELGYQFADRESALIDAGPEAVNQVSQLEEELGVLPLVSHVWYETLRSVDFCQADDQLHCDTSGIRVPAGPDIIGLGNHCVLIFQSLDGCKQQMEQMNVEEEKHWQNMKEWHPEEDWSDLEESGPFLPLGG